MLSVTPGSFIFNAVAGGSNPPTQNLTITNVGGSTLPGEAAVDIFLLRQQLQQLTRASHAGFGNIRQQTGTNEAGGVDG